MKKAITLAIDALASAAFIEGGVSPENTEAARNLTDQRKRELVEAIAAPQCLYQIEEPATKTEALAHYSQQAILAMDEAAPAAVAVPIGWVQLSEQDKADMLQKIRDWSPALHPENGYMITPEGAIFAFEKFLTDKARAALAATPAADAPAALTNPQPFGYVVTTPAGADLFYRHPADLTIHNDHRAETVYTLLAAQAAAPVVLPEPAVVATTKHESPEKGSVEFTWGGNALKEEGEHKLFTEQQMRAALLAGVSAPAAVTVDPASIERQIEEVMVKIGAWDIAWVEWQNAMSDGESQQHITEKQNKWLAAGRDLRDLLRTLLSGAPQAQADARDAWQPIESAPKDGAWIQLWRTPEPEESPASSTPLVIGRWSDEEEAFVWPDDPFYDPFTAHGKESADRMVEALRTYLSNEFTHWAPLSMPSANIAAQAAAQGGA